MDGLREWSTIVKSHRAQTFIDSNFQSAVKSNPQKESRLSEGSAPGAASSDEVLNDSVSSYDLDVSKYL